MCRAPIASGSGSCRSAPIAVSARQYHSLLLDLRRAGIPISKSSSQRNRAARPRGRRGAGSEASRDKWWYDEQARRCKQSACSQARARLVIPVCVSPLLQVWRSAVALSRARRCAVLQSVVPVSISWLLSQWRGGYLSHVPVVLYPDPYAAPFTPPCDISNSVASRVVRRRCLRHYVPSLPAVSSAEEEAAPAADEATSAAAEEAAPAAEEAVPVEEAAPAAAEEEAAPAAAEEEAAAAAEEEAAAAAEEEAAAAAEEEAAPAAEEEAVFKLMGCTLLPLRAVVRQWQQRRPRHTSPKVESVLKLLQCTFAPLRAVLRRWWSHDLFGSHHFKHINEVRPLVIRGCDVEPGSPWYLRLSRRIPALCKFRYLRVHRTVVLKCTLVPMLAIIHRWWDLHLLPHPADRPHLYAGKYTEDYLLSVRRSFDASHGGEKLATLPSGWFYCEECKHRFLSKFMGDRSCLCLMCEEVYQPY